jgi:hypothetical protein
MPLLKAATLRNPTFDPGAFYHTPLPSAFGYGVSYGLEAGSLFLLPWSTWLPSLFSRVARLTTSASGGGSWLRHLTGLPALTEVHLDLPLAMPHQVGGAGNLPGRERYKAPVFALAHPHPLLT